jgi:hypothetical protein
MTGTDFFLKTIIAKHLLAHVSLQRTPLRSQQFFQRSGSILMPFSKKACGWRRNHSRTVWMIMRFILHALSALSEALTPLKHTGP